jgi:RimJ/RimL family protein N-acetyltransferase
MKLELKIATEEDAEFVFDLMKDKDCEKYIITKTQTKNIEEQKKKLRSYFAQSKKKSRYYFIAKIGKNKIGIIDIYNVNSEDKRCCIGYAIDAKNREKGFGKKIVKEGLKFIKTKLKFHGCEAITDPKNKASGKILKKNGFKKIGTLKDYRVNKGKYLDRELYWKVL